MKDKSIALSEKGMVISMMKSQICQIFKQCFPSLIIEERLFYEKLGFDSNHIITIKEDNCLVGFSLINKNALLLLCVIEQYRNQGYGSKLLMDSEEYIKEQGYNEIILGCGKNYLFQGVPYDMENEQKVYLFFKKRGYKADWESVDMTMELDSFSVETAQIEKPIEYVSLRYANVKDQSHLIEAVAEVEPSWCQYYRLTEDPILLACHKEEIIGFCILSTDSFFKNSISDKVGGISCLGVIPSARRQGIGMYLAAVGTEELKRMGCTTAYIGYTYLEEWYGNLGYQTFLRFWMGVKQVPM